MSGRWFVRAVAAAAMLDGAAEAGEEKKCAAQYSLEEHLILEWAALGGDPEAQYAIGQCAFPNGAFPAGAADMTRAEKAYALKWLTLAACDAVGVEGADERDRLTRKLKLTSDLSFRRFGGITDEEVWNAREKHLIASRDTLANDLVSRLTALRAAASPQEDAAAREMLADELARMGPMGLMRLAELTTCKAFGASETFAAAAADAASEVWVDSDADAVHGDSVKKDFDIAAASAKRIAALSKSERRLMKVEKERLLRADPARIEKLEEQAALGRLQEFGFADAAAEGLAGAGRATTTAIQYALEALGFIEFVNGPDNDYGPSTIEAAGKAQAAYGAPQTRWLSPDEVRLVVCDAAVKKGDPVSYYHLSMMYAQGLGFRKDIARANAAISEAETRLAARLAESAALPEWKAREYPLFAGKISAARAAIAGEYAATPLHVRGGADAGVCR